MGAYSTAAHLQAALLSSNRLVSEGAIRELALRAVAPPKELYQRGPKEPEKEEDLDDLPEGFTEE